LILIRRTFQQYVNLRPVRLFEGVETPLKNWKPGGIDFVIVRENGEGEYSNVVVRIYEATAEDGRPANDRYASRRHARHALRF
jgi:tartrate dehydrogenase/decarboxylase/D-malate dehydrogenase